VLRRRYPRARGALRRWPLDRDALPACALLAAVPVNIRGRDDNGIESNRPAKVIAALPTHLERPDQRLRATREAMATAKAQFSAIRPDPLTDIAQLAIPALADPATGFATRVDPVVEPVRLQSSQACGGPAPGRRAPTRRLSDLDDLRWPGSQDHGAGFSRPAECRVWRPTPNRCSVDPVRGRHSSKWWSR
jgi:hypothetical protein